MVTESLGFGATSLLSPLLQGWRNAVAYQLLGIQQLFPRRGERDATKTVAANRQRLAPAIDALIVPEGNGARRQNCHIRAVAVSNFVKGRARLKVSKGKVCEHPNFSPDRDGQSPSPIKRHTDTCESMKPSFWDQFLPSRTAFL